MSRARIPPEELHFTYVRSSGPGGQNVNKVNTKAVLRWSVTASRAVSEPVRQRFLARYARRVTATGDMLVTSQRYRDQARNAADCVTKLQELVEAVTPEPIKRKVTRPSRAARARRQETKRLLSHKKQSRRSRPSED